MWLAVQAVPPVMAPLSLLLGFSANPAVDTLLRANRLLREAKVEARAPLVMHSLKNPCVVAWTDAAWAVRRDGSSQGGHLVALADGDALLNREFRANVITWHSGKLPRVARSSSAAEVQAACAGQEELEYVRLVVYEVLHGAFPLKQWEASCRSIPGALVMDCRGVYDALQSESSALGMSDRRSALEALGLKRALRSTATTLRWTHSGAQLADCLTKDTVQSKASWQLLCRRNYSWKLVYDPLFLSEKKRKQTGLNALDLFPQGEQSEDHALESDFLDTKNTNILRLQMSR